MSFSFDPFSVLLETLFFFFFWLTEKQKNLDNFPIPVRADAHAKLATT